MKKEFIGFYNPTQEETDESWNKGIFCFDANSILNLYRYSENTRNDFINALKSIKRRLFIPYQAAFEFHNNRLKVIEGTKSAYNKIENVYKQNFDVNIVNQLNGFKRHPALKLDSFKKLNDEFLSKISKELEKQKKAHPDFDSDDSILYSVTELFENCIGNDIPKTELRKIFEEGKNRYAEKIPPGYMDMDDKKGKGERNIYGDLIIWKQLIEYTKKEKKPIIFVTDDRKEDWWTIEGGKTIRAREELIKEFYDLTGIRILIYNADSFLHFAKEKKLLPGINETTLEEIKDIRVSDEKINSIIKLNIPTINNRKTNYYKSYFPKHSLKQNEVESLTTDYEKRIEELDKLLKKINYTNKLGKEESTDE
ncbi:MULTISPECIES: PIN domain-containing protein [Chryseobacterium]|uniref:PIN domain-containing protein n=1 Tax=Chryseobacterium TaxID=59732 RepID=UPI000C9EB515|nr:MULTISPECIES: PIN domain-containing protein [Chryseobacterium]VXC12056.1 conserved hypothetical protein [Chryseobacterium sp. 8AT]